MRKIDHKTFLVVSSHETRRLLGLRRVPLPSTSFHDEGSLVFRGHSEVQGLATVVASEVNLLKLGSFYRDYVLDDTPINKPSSNSNSVYETYMFRSTNYVSVS